MYQDNKITFTAHFFNFLIYYALCYLDREVWERERGTCSKGTRAGIEPVSFRWGLSLKCYALYPVIHRDSPLHSFTHIFVLSLISIFKIMIEIKQKYNNSLGHLDLFSFRTGPSDKWMTNWDLKYTRGHN